MLPSGYMAVPAVVMQIFEKWRKSVAKLLISVSIALGGAAERSFPVSTA
jgi:hypothetical protein